MKVGNKWVRFALGWSAAAWIFFPILWMLMASLKSESQAYATPPVIFFRPTLDNFRAILEQPSYARYALNSVYVSCGATLLAMVLSIPAAYAMAFRPGRRTHTILVWIMSTKMMPPVSALIPIYLILGHFALLDSVASLIVVFAILTMYFERFSLKDRVAVVTGAGRGIGLEIARALGEAGATVVIAEINEANGQKAAKQLSEMGHQSDFLPLDVTDSVAVGRAADMVIKNYGKVDVLVNNAGYANNIDAIQYADDDYYRLMRINLDGVFFCCRSFGRHMTAARRGSIVNIGSMSGIIVNKPQPQAPYNASKAGVHMLTKSFACEWASFGVRVNALAPGYIATEMTSVGRSNAEWYRCWTDMTPMGRCGEASEVASAVLFLASDAASYVTGSVLSVDGGYTAW